ncbi:hypothetical protein EV676_10461 [Caldimonas thermodepolymerans]|uniref:Uncharacterized protein n=1 Tax=Caldimonas thermodepolymerans TaxID=215580 RepID=A0AA46HW21_9BURK|nr:hypothetical protein EV676_10461 [Caldimonas thermodepolymerans]
MHDRQAAARQGNLWPALVIATLATLALAPWNPPRADGHAAAPVRPGLPPVGDAGTDRLPLASRGPGPAGASLR